MIIGELGYALITGDAKEQLATLPENHANCCITSPPYFRLRDYECEGQIGQEETLNEYVERLVRVFRQVRRVLFPDGSLWLNLGDTYSPGVKYTGIPQGNLLGVPWRVAFALQKDGWFLRTDIIWEKPDGMPDGAKCRPSRNHEHVFMLTKSRQPYFDVDAVRVPYKSERMRRSRMSCFGKAKRGGIGNHATGRGDVVFDPRGKAPRTVWQIPVGRYGGDHFATFPEELVERCLLAGCPEGGLAMDVFSGHATTGVVALKNGRHYLGIELNPEYNHKAKRRLDAVVVE